MNQFSGPYREADGSKTKIIATVGPSCESPPMLRAMAEAGVDVFRLNFAHGEHGQLAAFVAAIRRISGELGRPIAILGDLGGPKIRLEELPGGTMQIDRDRRYALVRREDAGEPDTLATTYDGLIDELGTGDHVVLADGLVSLRVVEKRPDRVVCVVGQPGMVRSGQGVNLPDIDLSLPSVTAKDRADLGWALDQGLDFVGLSFVRRAGDVRALRRLIDEFAPAQPPMIVAKIEKPAAVADLENIVAEADAVMVARGDLGVEVDVVRVPVIQKEIIRACNRQRVPVITATQMLDSMERSKLPTRAEASDVANAVLDGTDAVMLSGETAIGEYPREAVAMMSRIVREAEPLLDSNRELPMKVSSRNAATRMTRAAALGAMHAAEQLAARLIVVLTHSGRTAVAVSKLRNPMPVLALTDSPCSARRLCMAWGVIPVVTEACHAPPQRLTDFVVDWARRHEMLDAGDHIVLLGTTDWSQPGKDLMLTHTVELERGE